MSGAYFPKSALGRLFKIAICLSVVTGVAACSSASERFTPYQGRAAVKDPGHQQLPNMAENRKSITGTDNIHTASINRNASDVSVTSRSLAPIGTPPKSGQITVRTGDTLYSLSRANGTTVDQMVKANNLQAPYVIKPGQVLRVPGTPLVAKPAPSQHSSQKPSYKKSGRYSRHEVLSGENVKSIADLYGLKVETIGRFNDMEPPFTVKTGQVLKIPYSDKAVTIIKPVARKPRPNMSFVPIPIPVSNPLRTEMGRKHVSEYVPLPKPKPTWSPKPVKKQARTSIKSSRPQILAKPAPRSSNQFRWPVKGRIISQYGAKPNGIRNDGINVAVPFGASVKAAENGVVTYAGNELQGYGNLVIISHADNWVTLYAHNDKLLVKKGHIVQRGQIISKAGKTGQVSSPQVHFEIRKGAKVVNPVKYMAPLQYAGKH